MRHGEQIVDSGKKQNILAGREIIKQVCVGINIVLDGWEDIMVQAPKESLMGTLQLCCRQECGYENRAVQLEADKDLKQILSCEEIETWIAEHRRIARRWRSLERKVVQHLNAQYPGWLTSSTAGTEASKK